MMNNIKIERDANGKVIKGIVSKNFLKRADMFGTDEYLAMQKFCEMHPEAEIKVKTIKKNPDKETNKHLTYENMELFIKTITSDEEKLKKLLEEMKKIKSISQIQKSPYKYVLDWFKAMFPDYTSHDIFKDKEEKETKTATETNNVIQLKQAK